MTAMMGKMLLHGGKPASAGRADSYRRDLAHLDMAAAEDWRRHSPGVAARLEADPMDVTAKYLALLGHGRYAAPLDMYNNYAIIAHTLLLPCGVVGVVVLPNPGE
jgi:hypothetical protein